MNISIYGPYSYMSGWLHRPILGTVGLEGLRALARFLRAVDSSWFIAITSSEPLPPRREENWSKGGDRLRLVEIPNSEERKQKAERGNSLSKPTGDNER